jgi:hypothetical protein
MDSWPKLAREDGPADLIARVRAALGASPLGKLLDCFQCLSLWVAAPLALWIAAEPVDACVVWLAVSGAACLCERLGPPDVVVQPLPEPNQGGADGVLRTET